MAPRPSPYQGDDEDQPEVKWVGWAARDYSVGRRKIVNLSVWDATAADEMAVPRVGDGSAGRRFDDLRQGTPLRRSFWRLPYSGRLYGGRFYARHSASRSSSPRGMQCGTLRRHELNSHEECLLECPRLHPVPTKRRCQFPGSAFSNSSLGYFFFPSPGRYSSAAAKACSRPTMSSPGRRVSNAWASRLISSSL